MRPSVPSLALGVLLGTTGVGYAQGVGAVVEGPGYPVGEGTVLHPIVGAEAGFNSNLFYEKDDPTSTGLFRVLLEAAIASKKVPEPSGTQEGEPATQAVQFRASAKLGYTEYISDEDAVREQRGLSADVGGNVTVAPQGTISFEASERLVRETRPTTYYSFDGMNRIVNNLGLGIKYRPGGGTMKFGLGWENRIDFFEETDQRFANRMVNLIRGKYDWKVFPFTNVTLDASYGFVADLGDEGALMATKRDAQPLRVAAGIATSLTPVTTAKVQVGWAQASYEGGDSYSTPVAGIEFGYRYSPLGRVVALYNLDRQDSISADFYRDHHFGARLEQQLNRFTASLNGEFRLRQYRGISSEIGAPVRDDVIVAGSAKLDVRFRDWLAAVAEVRTESDQTDYRIMTSSTSDDPSYVRTEATAGLRAAF